MEHNTATALGIIIGLLTCIGSLVCLVMGKPGAFLMILIIGIIFIASVGHSSKSD